MDKDERRKIAEELGFWPADFSDEAIAKHRRDNAAVDAQSDPSKKFPHLR